jgi:hypothetical protein
MEKATNFDTKSSKLSNSPMKLPKNSLSKPKSPFKDGGIHQINGELAFH